MEENAVEYNLVSNLANEEDRKRLRVMRARDLEAKRDFDPNKIVDENADDFLREKNLMYLSAIRNANAAKRLKWKKC